MVPSQIIDVCPSSDWIVRVVKEKTMTGEYVRPAVKISPLECDNNFEVPQGGSVRNSEFKPSIYDVSSVTSI